MLEAGANRELTTICRDFIINIRQIPKSDGRKGTIMKKLIALLLAVLLLASIPSVAFAAGNKQAVAPAETPVEQETDDTPEYYWSDLEPYLEALGLEGQFYTFNYYGLDIWVPDELEFQELTDEDIENGMIAYATDEDENWIFAVTNLVYEQKIKSLYEWQDILKKYEGIEESVICYVNDLIVLEYLVPEKDCFVCDLRVSDGSILEFVWAPFSDQAYAVNTGFMSNSLMDTND